MDILTFLTEFILHADQYIALLIQTYGLWTYIVLFLVIFLETGLVITPFLPGDSLIFVAGTFAATGSLDPLLLFLTLASAAILGDTANYWIGHFLGPKVFRKKASRLFNEEYLERAQKFYDKHGGKAIFLARFVPIVRTFAPFVAGIGSMSYRRFLLYNILGGLVWVSAFLLGGYWFGNIPIVQENLTLVIIAIIGISFIPVLVEFIKYRISKKK